MEDILNTGRCGHIMPISVRKEISAATKLGLERARAKGKKGGRRRVEINWAKIESLKEKGLSERAAARVCGYPLTTFYRRKKELANGLQHDVDTGCGSESESTYIIHAPSVKRVKIGCTKNVRDRYYAIQVGSPVPVVLVCTFEALGYEFERHLHVKYEAYNTHGEWFDDKILPMILEDPELQKIMKEYLDFDIWGPSPPMSTPEGVTCNAQPIRKCLDSSPQATRDIGFLDGGRTTNLDPIKTPLNTGETQELHVTDLSDLGNDATSIMQEARRLQDAGVKIISENKRDELILNSKPEHRALVTLAVAFGENLQWMKFKEDAFVKRVRDKSRENGRKIGRPRVEVDLGLVDHLMKRGLSERAAAKVCGYPLTTFYRRKKEKQEIERIDGKGQNE